MNSKKPVLQPTEREINRQTWACLGVFVLIWCMLMVLSAGLAVALVPRNIDRIWNSSTQTNNKSDTGQIAFVSDRDGNPEIYTMNDGSSVTRITDNPSGDFNPAWSPDGTQIAFYSERDGNAEIYVVNVDGTGEARRLTNHPAADYNPSWSPDGKLIAFHSHRYKEHGRIFVMNVDGSDVRRLTHPEWDDWSPVWSPDGKEILFNSSRGGNRNIWLMNSDGTNLRELTHHSSDDWWPDWSPDGSKIVFHSDRNSDFNVYIMNKNGSKVTCLTDSTALDYDPVWSSDGTLIAFTSDRSGNLDVWAMHPDGSGEINLTGHPAQDWAPAWRPDPAALLAHPGQETEEVTTQESSSDPELEIPEPGTNLAYGKQVRVSHELAEKPAEWAVDGKSETWWGAGAFPPQWIEVDLGANYVIAEIRLLPSQTPTGKTIHRLFVKGISTNDEYEILHTFQGVTADSRWIVLKLPEALREVRYLRIETTSSSSWVSWREVEVIAGE
jgi:Tol biopolymer transport system component